MTNNYVSVKEAKSVIGFLRSDESLKWAMPFTKYIKELRTVGLALPRQSGKSTLLRTLSRQYSSLIICKNRNQMDPLLGGEGFVLTLSKLDSHDFRGWYTMGLKYQCILIDEYDSFTESELNKIDEYIKVLQYRGLLTEDFFVFYVTTLR